MGPIGIRDLKNNLSYAIHLATVELLGETPQFVTIVTRDRHIRENAIAMGYAVE